MQHYLISLFGTIGIAMTLLGFILIFKQNNKFKYLSNYKLDRFKENIKRVIRLKINNATELTKKERFVIIAIVLLLISTTRNVQVIPSYIFYGSIFGFALVRVFSYMKEQTEKSKKLKEIAILFEAVELYTKAGYNIFQALRTAKVLTTVIRPAIDKCLNYWGAGSKKALELLQKELNLQEAETLILLLMHMEVVGSKELEGVMKREAFNIERIQKMKSQMKIANRPVILMVYRMLPLMSVLGISIGSLLYRTVSTLTSAGIL